METFVFLLVYVGFAFFYCFWRNTAVYRVRTGFLYSRDLWPEAYERLPGYWSMLFNPKYLHLWTKAQWEQWVLTQGGYMVAPND